MEKMARLALQETAVFLDFVASVENVVTQALRVLPESLDFQALMVLLVKLVHPVPLDHVGRVAHQDPLENGEELVCVV